jgi:uncharacterized protein YndB with AHSA1/START domain
MEILLEMAVRVSPDRVYAALTEREGLVAWLAPDVTAEPRPGSIAEFRFDGGKRVMRVEIVTLDPGRKVGWRVLEGVWQVTEGRESGESGKGLITWELSSPFGPERCLVHFRHDGWETAEGAFASVNFKWATFMMNLKTYLQAGQGGAPS